MKRDMDLARRILLAIEEQPYTQGAVVITVEDCTQEGLEYHIMLLDEAGLIKAQKPLTRAMGWSPIRLTWAGHEFLEVARSDKHWAKAKGVMSQAGGWTLEVAQKILVDIVTTAATAALRQQGLG